MKTVLASAMLAFGLLAACDQGPSREEIAAQAAAEAAEAERLAAIEAKTRECNAEYERLLAALPEAKKRFEGVNISPPITYGELVSTLGPPDEEEPGVRNEWVARWFPMPSSPKETTIRDCVSFGTSVVVHAVSASFVVNSDPRPGSDVEACSVSIRPGFPGSLWGYTFGGTADELVQRLLAAGKKHSESHAAFSMGDGHLLQVNYSGQDATGDLYRLEAKDSFCIRF